MKRFFTALSILVLFLVSPNISNAQQGVIESDPFDIIIPNSISSTVQIITVNFGKFGRCTGVVIKNTPTKSIVLTAKHCVVFEGDMYIGSLKVDTVVASYKSDIAYLTLNEFIPYKTPVRLSNYIPAKGDKFIGIGYPTKGLTIVKGSIFVQTPTEQYVWTKEAIPNGSSGGGAFNKDGELIGIMVRYHSIVKMGILVRLEDIHALINANKLLE